MSLSNEDGPAELVPPEARTIGGNPIIERRKPPSGDPFTAKTPRPDEKRLAVLEELRDRVLRLREAVQKVRGER